MKALSSIILICLLFFIALGFAEKKKTIPQLSTFTVKAANNATSFLYFQGEVQPIKQYDVLAPISGVVNRALNFNYGAHVEKGQYLLSILPNDEQNAYRSALIAYLRAKSSYHSAKNKLTGQTFLYQKGILSRNAFNQYKDNLTNQNIALTEAYYRLKAVLKKISSDKKVEQNLLDSLSSLTLSDRKLNSALNLSFNEVKIHALATGVAFLPIENSSDSRRIHRLHKNSVVKLDQSLLAIGDFSGLKITVNVSEISINKLKIGQSAIVTGPAFPTMKLQGSVTAISYQANTGGFGSSLPTYPVTITVPRLTAAQQNIIHAGMTAYVNIIVSQGNALFVPIKAVQQQAGKPYVLKLVQGKKIKTPVQTGSTTLDRIEIVKGLKAGDNIVVPN